MHLYISTVVCFIQFVYTEYREISPRSQLLGLYELTYLFHSLNFCEEKNYFIVIIGIYNGNNDIDSNY